MESKVNSLYDTCVCWWRLQWAEEKEKTGGAGIAGPRASYNHKYVAEEGLSDTHTYTKAAPTLPCLATLGYVLYMLLI